MGLRVLASLSGGVRVVQDGAGRSTSAVENELAPTYAPSVGLRFDAGQGVRAALVARAPLRADFDVRVAAPSLGVIVLPDFDITGVAAYDPAEVHGEVSKRMGALTVLAALTYKRWSDFPGFLGATFACPPTRPMCTALPAAPANFHDTWVPRAALSYSFELGPRALATLRAGYFYEPTPIPEQTGDANTWDNARHAVSIGYGVELVRPLLPLRLDAALQFHQLVAQTHHKDASIAATNAGYPTVTVRGNALSLGLSAGISF